MYVWFTDLRDNWLSWVGVAVSLMFSSTSCAVAISMIIAGGDDSGSLGGIILGMCLCSIVLVTASHMRLIVDEHKNVYRSWQRVGMPGWLIVAVVVGQACVVGVMASAIGLIWVPLLLSPVESILREDGIPMETMHLSMNVAVISAAVCAGTCVLGTLLSIPRIFRMKKNRRIIWVAVKMFLAAAAIGGTISPTLDSEKVSMSPDDLMGWSSGFVLVVALFTPWIIPLCEQITRLCGLGGANIRRRRTFSSPQIMPWIICGGLLVSMGSGIRMLMDSSPNAHASNWKVFAVLLAPTIVPSLVAALSISLIMRHCVARDVRALRLAGAPRHAPLVIQICEACGLTLMAAGLIAAVTAYIVRTMNHALYGVDSMIDGFWWDAFIVIFGAMLVGTAIMKILIASRAMSRY